MPQLSISYVVAFCSCLMMFTTVVDAISQLPSSGSMSQAMALATLGSASSLSAGAASASSPASLSASNPAGSSITFDAPTPISSASTNEAVVQAYVASSPSASENSYPNVFPAYLDDSYRDTRIVTKLSDKAVRYMQQSKPHPPPSVHHAHIANPISIDGSKEDQEDPDIQKYQSQLTTVTQTIEDDTRVISESRKQMYDLRKKIRETEENLEKQNVEARRLRLLLKNQHKFLARKKLESEMDKVRASIGTLQKQADGVTGQKTALVIMKKKLQNNIKNLEAQIGLLHRQSEDSEEQLHELNKQPISVAPNEKLFN